VLPVGLLATAGVGPHVVIVLACLMLELVRRLDPEELL